MVKVVEGSIIAFGATRAVSVVESVVVAGNGAVLSVANVSATFY